MFDLLGHGWAPRKSGALHSDRLFTFGPLVDNMLILSFRHELVFERGFHLARKRFVKFLQGSHDLGVLFDFVGSLTFTDDMV